MSTRFSTAATFTFDPPKPTPVSRGQVPVGLSALRFTLDIRKEPGKDMRHVVSILATEVRLTKAGKPSAHVPTTGLLFPDDYPILTEWLDITDLTGIRQRMLSDLWMWLDPVIADPAEAYLLGWFAPLIERKVSP